LIGVKMQIYNKEFEDKLFLEGKRKIAGVDEVGRGPIAGPVVAACVVLPPHFFLEGLTDSKQLSAKKREFFFSIILQVALDVSFEFVFEDKIDHMNIYQATKLAMIKAIEGCIIQPDYVLVDAMKLDISIPMLGIIKGDQRSISIAAASVVAKVVRDRYMVEMAKKYPHYGFDRNKGYPTKEHKTALINHGACEIHRKSFSPVKELFIEQMKYDF